MSLTFRQLAEHIDQMSDEQKDCDVSIYDGDNDEYYCVKEVVFATEECQVLDVDHPILRF
jgi:hypothetical protein